MVKIMVLKVNMLNSTQTFVNYFASYTLEETPHKEPKRIKSDKTLENWFDSPRNLFFHMEVLE